MSAPSAPPQAVDQHPVVTMDTTSIAPLPEYWDESADPPPAYTNLHTSSPDSLPERRELHPSDKCSTKKEAKDTGYSSDDELSSGESRHKNVMLKKGIACVGWLLCCPLMVCGLCLRESPTDDNDLHDDPCLPCYYASRR